jgi:LmbE family N-acetylglucosaminyl deacetylase
LGFRLMCITAHPDDESAAFGGALLMAKAQGIETSVICLTDGQAATHRGSASGGEELAILRRREFAAACTALGVTEFEVLDYPDGELPRIDFYAGVAALVQRIRRFRPHVLLTFGSEGGVNLHRDHTMSSLLATAAFHWSGRDSFFPEQLEAGLQSYFPQKLYAVTPPFIAPVEGIQHEQVAKTPCSLKLELGELKQQKVDAFLLHSTQKGVLARVRDAFEKYGDFECYWLIASRCATGGDGGMFDGIEEEQAQVVA